MEIGGSIVPDLGGSTTRFEELGDYFCLGEPTSATDWRCLKTLVTFTMFDRYPFNNRFYSCLYQDRLKQQPAHQLLVEPFYPTVTELNILRKCKQLQLNTHGNLRVPPPNAIPSRNKALLAKGE